MSRQSLVLDTPGEYMCSGRSVTTLAGSNARVLGGLTIFFGRYAKSFSREGVKWDSSFQVHKHWVRRRLWKGVLVGEATSADVGL